MLSTPNDCNVMDPQLEAILDDVLTDFVYMDTKGLGMPPKLDKNVNVTMHSCENIGIRLCDQKDD